MSVKKNTSRKKQENIKLPEITEDSRVEIVARSSINFASYNPRRMGDFAKTLLHKSLDEFGMVDFPIMNESTGVLVQGHQRLTVLDEKYGYPENDYSFKCIIINVDERTEKKLNIALNNNNMQGEYIEDLLRDMLVELDDGADDIASTGFTTEEIKQIIDQSSEKSTTTETDSAGGSDLLTHIMLEVTLDEKRDIVDFFKQATNKSNYTRREMGRLFHGIVTQKNGQE